MEVKNYIFAGLDFIFDKKGNPWFLEANYFPGGAYHIEDLYGKDTIVKELAKKMKDYNNPCMLIAKRSDSRIYNSTYIAEKLKEYMDIKMCYAEPNFRRKSSLITTENKKIKSNCILRYDQKLNNHFEKNSLVINSNLIEKVVNDKMLTLKIVNERTNVNVPRSFYVKSKKEMEKILEKEEFEEGFVIKPNDLTEGIDVLVLTNKEKLPIIRSKRVFEERISPKKKEGRYWDVRVYIINGKYMGGFIRESRKRVTNISIGAKPYKIPPKINRILRSPSLKVVAAIDKYCEEKRRKRRKSR
tara:strand:+ start:407 stop:1306 length:900 start_codon:yes stop_codon:yes gene_type:complete